MKIKWAARLLLVLVGALGMGVGHAAADVMYSQTLYVRDPWGNLTGARVVITLPTVNHFYIIDMSRQFLDL
ncbi:MAG: hypothetical protein JO112_04475, partial [Planctomycetes bacterium]|nr:hypothetical protein [Planctomycetota bacterium]